MQMGKILNFYQFLSHEHPAGAEQTRLNCEQGRVQVDVFHLKHGIDWLIDCDWLFVFSNFLQLEMYHFVVCKVGLLAQSGNVIHDECLDLVMGLLTSRYQRVEVAQMRSDVKLAF